MKAILVLLSSVPIVAAVMQSAPDQPARDLRDLTGVYACEGVGPDGATYRGVVEIVRSSAPKRVVGAIACAAAGLRVTVYEAEETIGGASSEFNAVRPLDRDGRGWMSVFNMRPGF